MIYYVMYLIGWARGLIWRAPDVAKAQPFTTSTSTRTSPIEIGAAYLDTRELGLHHLILDLTDFRRLDRDSTQCLVIMLPSPDSVVKPGLSTSVKFFFHRN